MRILLLFFLLTISVTSVTAACIPSSLFDPDLSVSSLRFPSSVDAIASGTPIRLELDPDSDVSEVRLLSINVESDVNVRVRFFVEPDGDAYILTPRFTFGTVTMDDLEDAEFSLEADVSYVKDGRTYEETICLGELEASIMGDFEGFVDQVEGLFNDLEAIDSVFDLIDVLIGAGRIMSDFECREARAAYGTLESAFEESCSEWTMALTAVVDGATPADACGGIIQCENNLTGANGGANCPVIYSEMLKLEENLSVCYRNECAPVLTVEAHAQDYTDPLGRSLCTGSDIDDPACRLEFERVQAGRCPAANVTALERAGEPADALPSLTDICIDAEAREEFTVLKDPTADIVSSTSCMCLPAMQGHVDQIEQLYALGLECLGESGITEECKSASFTFICEMVIGSALQCSDIGYQEYSASANVFSVDGVPLDFSDPDEAARRIAEGGVIVSSGSAGFSIDTDRLTHEVCESALGNASIDWASILSFDTNVEGRSGELCASGERLSGSCVCDLTDLSGDGLDMCGRGQGFDQCVYDVPNRQASCQPYDEDDDPSLDASRNDRALREFSSLPPGRYGDASDVYGCTETGLTVTVTTPLGTEPVTLTSGIIVLPQQAASQGALAYRTYSCVSNELDITIDVIPLTQ